MTDPAVSVLLVSGLSWEFRTAGFIQFAGLVDAFNGLVLDCCAELMVTELKVDMKLVE